ncbi:replicative DNA helicase [Oceanibacterium hippocampi]|uniref:Replicative DNA helicase n=1 Tax=Oceanibacterium hippocampi TaxID=745714 RepID=A0A1Y5SYP0_9PROT|nr:replicative DNA helicase [Oceanibacterium hippocampi]SLN48118.1 Replicative DNA helicase [Oceanibacterium hippocampi]
MNTIDLRTKSSPGSEAGDGPALYRTAPSNVEAEQDLLGAILVNNEAYSKVSDFLEAQHFHEGVHARIYAAAQRLIERGEIANPVTLKAFFEHDEGLADIGGTQYLARLAAGATTVINAGDYGRTVYDLAIRRELIRLGEEVVNRAYDAQVDEGAAQQLELAERQLFELAERGAGETGPQHIRNTVKTSIEVIDTAFNRDGNLTGVTTGLRDMDKKLGGLHRSDLVILAGRPSMGKTSLATNIAYNAAKAHRRSGGTEGAVVAVFSLEMSAEQLTTRILAEATEISSVKLRSGEISQDDFVNRVVPASIELAELPLYIDDTPALSVAALRTRARRLKRNDNLGLIVVDYLQLMRAGSGNRIDSRVQEISEITMGLKAIAKEVNVPVLALSQLSRQVENREDKRPQLSDLRESGSIEQDSDVVMFVFREEYYEARKEPRENTPEHQQWQERMAEIHNLAEVIIDKQRHGPIGRVELYFNPEITKFGDLDRNDYSSGGGL